LALLRARRCRRGPPTRLAALLVSGASLLSACGSATEGKQTLAQLDPGARVYLGNCVACHQQDGQGTPHVQPSLVGAPVVAGRAEDMIAWVMFGQRPATLPAGQYSMVMPQFAYLSDEQIAAVLTHVRNSFGNAYGAVTVEQVAAARAARRTQ
jgi:mono/diheme cytochrome c family protein